MRINPQKRSLCVSQGEASEGKGELPSILCCNYSLFSKRSKIPQWKPMSALYWGTRRPLSGLRPPRAGRRKLRDLSPLPHTAAPLQTTSPRIQMPDTPFLLYASEKAKLCL